MGAVVSLSKDVERVEPGESASLTMTVRNTGGVVDEFTFECIADDADWISVEPPVLPLFPGSEESVQVIVSPPRTPTVPLGPFTFGVKASSREDPRNSAVAEATIEIAPFRELFAELVPRTSRGRRAGKSDLAIDNRGNTSADLELAGNDADGEVLVAVDPPVVETESGTASFAGVTVRPKKRFFRGPAKTHTYQVVATSPDAEPLLVDGTMVQEPLVPPWALRALAAAFLLLVLLILLWFTLLKPTVESAARDAAVDAVDDAMAGPLGQQAAQIAALEEATTGTTSVPALEPDEPAGPAGGLLALGSPFDARLAASAPEGQSGNHVITVSDDHVLSITDVFLQNPQGDAGRLRIRRGDAILLEVALQNFRDLDYHFVSPLTFRGGEQVVLDVSCESTLSDRCRAAAYVTGFLDTQGQ